MPQYQLIFNAADFQVNNWTFMPVPLILTVVGIFLIKFSGKPKVTWYSNWPPHPIFAWFFFLFVASISVVIIGLQVNQWLEIRAAVAQHNYHVVNGPVQDFKPMPREGHAEESFSVSGVRFSYSDFEVTQGFRNTEAYGGPIHANSRVRLGYICRPSETDCSNPLIIKVEIEK